MARLWRHAAWADEVPPLGGLFGGLLGSVDDAELGVKALEYRPSPSGSASRTLWAGVLGEFHFQTGFDELPSSLSETVVFGYPVDGADDVVVDRGTRWLSSSRHLAAQIGAEGS